MPDKPKHPSNALMPAFQHLPVFLGFFSGRGLANNLDKIGKLGNRQASP
jgi:hypothetical protein